MMSKVTSITVSIGRTIQLRPYEPYNVTMSATVDVTDITDNVSLDLEYQRVRDDLEAHVDAACETKRASAVEPARY